MPRKSKRLTSVTAALISADPFDFRDIIGNSSCCEPHIFSKYSSSRILYRE